MKDILRIIYVVMYNYHPNPKILLRPLRFAIFIPLALLPAALYPQSVKDDIHLLQQTYLDKNVTNKLLYSLYENGPEGKLLEQKQGWFSVNKNDHSFFELANLCVLTTDSLSLTIDHTLRIMVLNKKIAVPGTGSPMEAIEHSLSLCDSVSPLPHTPRHTSGYRFWFTDPETRYAEIIFDQPSHRLHAVNMMKAAQPDTDADTTPTFLTILYEPVKELPSPINKRSAIGHYLEIKGTAFIPSPEFSSYEFINMIQ